MQGNHWSNGPPQIQQQQQQQHKQMSHSNLNEPPQGTIVNPSVIKAQIDAIHTIATLRDQIHQSELNLSAQQGVSLLIKLTKRLNINAIFFVSLRY